MNSRSVIQGLRTPLGSLRLLLLLASVSLVAALLVHTSNHHQFLCGMALGILVPAGFLTFNIREITFKDDDGRDDLKTLQLS